ncbi:toxin VasX [Vibrio mexicanus]|uniref:toxin VasX n=1 Tax=Vibrio mexicanus TaxID=1004326 RepID=UPI000B2EAA40|nr:toxin VasX [Vibrio mexicanus]
MKMPIPPKTSMMWVNSKNSFAESYAIYARDGNLISLTEKSEQESNDVDGSPPETSMFWEGGTEKIEPNEAEPELCDYSRKEDEQEVETVHFIPVRYAIDELADDNTQPFHLPEGWVGTGPAKLKNHNYTLRQLRDGWLYVYDAKAKALDEYKVEGNQLTNYKLGASEDVETDIVRGVAQEEKPYLSYPEGSVLSLCFSPHRWSWTFFEMVANSPDKHISKMQTVVLTPGDYQPHLGELDTLSDVADIEESAVDDQRFAFSCVKTSEPEPIEGIEDEAPLKPVTVHADLISYLPEDETAFVVAINDHMADIEDMALHFAGYASQFRVFEEQFNNQWMLMQTTMQLCMFGATQDTDLPHSLKTDAEKIDFYSDMADYYDASQNVDRATENQSAVSTGYPAKFSAGAKEAHQTNQERLAQTIRDKYRISETRFDRYDSWIASDRWRKQLNWKHMMADMRELTAEKERLLEPALASKLDFIAAMDALTPNHLERIVDLWGHETQFELFKLHQTVVDAFSLAGEESDALWANRQWEKPTSLWALSGAGFSQSIFQQIGKALPEPLPELPLAAATKLPESNEFDDPEASNALNARHVNWGMGVGGYSKVVDFMTNPNTHETLILKDLGRGFMRLDEIFMSSKAAIGRIISELGADFISKTTILMLSSVNQPLTRYSFCFRAVIVERLASAATIPINKNFASDYSGWKSRLDSSEVALKKQNALIVSFESNEGKVSRNQYKKALEKKASLSRSLNANALDYKLRIPIKPDAAESMKKAHLAILKGKVEDIHRHYNNLGGLGAIALIFNIISLYDAIEGLRQTGLMSTDEGLNILQSFFYASSAWTGLTTSKAWGLLKETKL